MILEFQNVSKRYGGVKALQSTELTLRGGKIHALLGGNGSGKSTLIKIAAGLVKKDEGSILLDGRPLEISSPAQAKRRKVVATAQELSLLPNLTVAENLTLCDMPLGVGPLIHRGRMRAEAQKVLAKLGMAEDIDMPVAQLPVNKQYLLEFGKAIYQPFDVLLIDEITSALYREDVEIVAEILRKYKAQGKIILFVSHRMDEIFAMCDAVTVMRNGEIIATYPLDTVQPGILLADMVGATTAVAQPKNTPTHGREVEGAPLLSVKGLDISAYRSQVALDIYKGEIIGVAGLQGHGQADLVQTLFGLKGSVPLQWDGKHMVIASPQQAVRNGFAYVSGDRERDGSFREHDLGENIKTVSDLIFKQKTDADEIMRSLGVKYDSSAQKITALSGGNQQKVIFGRWICAAPRLLLANDPSKGIDVNARAELREIMWRLTDEGMSIIFVSSDEDELIALCGPRANARVIVMYEGNIVKTLRGEEITRDRLIAATLAKGDAKHG